MNKLEQEVYELAGTEFNINSTKQVGEILFDRLKLDEKAKKTKQAVTVPARMYWRNFAANIPSSASFLNTADFKKLLSTYIDALPELINPQTGKIHTSFNQAVTSTGRLSSTNPNLQNIPVRDDLGRKIRKAFIPDNADCLFFSADYSQIELRIMPT